MGDGLDVSGGAGGMAADFADLRSQAGAMRGAGDDLLERVGRVSGVAVDGDVLTAALVFPDLVPGVEAAVLWAATGPNGLTVRGGALLASGTLIDASVTTYEFVDDTSKKALDALQTATGFVAGALLHVGIQVSHWAAAACEPRLFVPTRGVDIGPAACNARPFMYFDPQAVAGAMAEGGAQTARLERVAGRRIDVEPRAAR